MLNILYLGMKPITCLLACLLLIPLYAKSQNLVEKQAIGFIKTLKAKGVNTIVSYHPYCVGNELIISDTTKCQASDTYYVIWSNKKKNFVRRFDDCKTYQDSSNSANNIFKLLSAHFSQIKKERIKGVSVWEMYKGKRQLMEIMRDHSCHGDFTFYIHSDSIIKRIDYFDLETKFISTSSEDIQKPQNINYEYNQRTYLKHLLSYAEKIEKINFKAIAN